jgi:PBP1b-binding outer membrane lipoprotein LpoB
MKNRVTLLLLGLVLAFVLAGCQGAKSKPAIEATPHPVQPTAAPADDPSVAAAFQ